MRGPSSGGRLFGRALTWAFATAVLAGSTCVAALWSPEPAHNASSSTADPAANVYPNPAFLEYCSSTAYDDSFACVEETVQAIDNARAREGVGSLTLPSDWYSLSPAQQLYVATNLERTARGLPPLSAMAAPLDQAARQAASQGHDGFLPLDFPAGGWSSNWIGGSGNALEDVYFWMYDDGPGSNNVDCGQAGQPGCWDHRHNLLVALGCHRCVMGTGFEPTGWHGGTSWSEILADTTGCLAVDYSWSQVTPDLPSSEWGTGYAPQAGSPDGVAPQSTTGAGHRMVVADGGVFDFGADLYHGSVPGLGIDVNDIVGLAPTCDGAGYWLAGSDGGVFSFGDARFHGSVPGLRKVDDIVSITATPDDQGYWLVGRYGEVWSFGDAQYSGSPDGSGLPVSNIVGMAVCPSGGYWLVGSDGGVFAYGAAPYAGSLPGIGVSVNDVVGLAPTVDGGGYWLYGADGGVFSFGDAGYFGSLPGMGIRVDNVGSGTST